MEKVKVQICMGTACFVMGAGQLQELQEIVPQKYGNKVELSGNPCLGYCYESTSFSGAPYVTVDDVVISEATIEKVLIEIDKKLNI